jgi:DNA-binding LacI/PurR family transcriptional regulator
VRGGQIATEHLLGLGYQRIAHITGHLNIADGQDRLIGYRRALERAGIAFNPDLIHVGRFSYEGGYHGMRALLEQRPDAVFVSSDTAALGAMRAIQEAGLRIPDDIGVVGFDDLDVAPRAAPALTTIRQPVQKKGETALALLLDLLNGAIQPPHQIVLPVQLVIRESCGAKP